MKVSGFIWGDYLNNTYTCNYDVLKELGVDFPYIGYDNGMSYTLTGLDHAAANDMQIIVTAYPFWTYFKLTPNSTTSYSTNISKLLNHEALHSIYIWDEPTMARLDEVTRLVTKTRAWLNYVNSDKKLFINLLPTYATNEAIGVENFKDYVEAFVPLSDVVCGDYYFVKDHNGNTEISNNITWPSTHNTPEQLYIFYRELFNASKKYHKPLWLWLCSAKHNNYAMLNEIHLRLEFNIGYILGAEMMLFWTIKEPDNNTMNYTDWQISKEYTKGTTFDLVKNYLHNVASHLNEIYDKCTVIDFGKVDQDTPTIDEEVPFDSGTNDIYWNKMEDNEGYKYWSVMNFHASKTIMVKVKNYYKFYDKEFKEELVEDLYKEITLLPGELLIIKTVIPQYNKNISLNTLIQNQSSIIQNFNNKIKNNLQLINSMFNSINNLNSEISLNNNQLNTIKLLNNSISTIQNKLLTLENSNILMNYVNNSLQNVSQRLNRVENTYTEINTNIQNISERLDSLPLKEIDEPIQPPIIE